MSNEKRRDAMKNLRDNLDVVLNNYQDGKDDVWSKGGEAYITAFLDIKDFVSNSKDF